MSDRVPPIVWMLNRLRHGPLVGAIETYNDRYRVKSVDTLGGLLTAALGAWLHP